MNTAENTEEERLKIHNMFLEENRLNSFKDWVFDNCACTPKKVRTGNGFLNPWIGSKIS
jgi:hypothetical protein